MRKTIKWGILALGKIAEKFAADLALSKGATLYAAASRSMDKAQSFAQKHQCPHYFGSYEELLANSELDIIYIASPHAFHYEHTMMCLDADKHVLCEKPLAINYKQAKEMADKARSKSLFLSEGIWTRYIPATEKLLDLIKSGRIGLPKAVHADFGFKAEYSPENRLFNKQLGGGSLLDIGIYPVYLSLLIFGVPEKISAIAHFTKTGTDQSISILFGYKNGASSRLSSDLSVNTATEAWIYGDKAALKMHSRFHHSRQLSLYENHKKTESFQINYCGNGYVHEIEETVKCLNAGFTENPKLPLSFSLDLMQTLDEIRKTVSLRYPADLY